MTDYTKITNFAAKDDLPQNNPNKVIRGSEFDAEFNAVSAALASKLDVVPVYDAVVRDEVVGTTLTVTDNSPATNGLVITSTTFNMNDPDRQILIEHSFNYTISIEELGNHSNVGASFQVKYVLVNNQTSATADVDGLDRGVFESSTISNAKNNTVQFLFAPTTISQFSDMRLSSLTVEDRVGVSNSGYTLRSELELVNIDAGVVVRINNDGTLVVKEIQ